MIKKITITGGDEAVAGIRKTANELPGMILQAMVEACSLVETRAKTHHLAGATLQARSHRLQQSVKMDVKQAGTKITGRVGSPVVYAAIHEFGGIIRPKNAKYLVFQIDGRFIRARQVTMPKREWLLKSFQDVQGKIEGIFGRKVEIAIG